MHFLFYSFFMIAGFTKFLKLHQSPMRQLRKSFSLTPNSSFQLPIYQLLIYPLPMYQSYYFAPGGCEN